MCIHLFQESNGPSDAYAAISSADRLQAEPESLRKWREEQGERLEVLGERDESTHIRHVPTFKECETSHCGATLTIVEFQTNIFLYIV